MQAERAIPEISAFVFDAYGTLLDFGAAVARQDSLPAGQAQALTELWRQKQIEYSWRRSLMGAWVDFWQITGESLDFALDSLDIHDPALRQSLLDAYFSLDCYPEVVPLLQALKQAGKKTAILSNGSPAMLDGAVRAGGLDGLLDAVLSVNDVKIFKPHPRTYQLALDWAGAVSGAENPQQIAFFSSNGWDVRGASHFGFTSVWVNRAGAQADKIPAEPFCQVKDLSDILPLFGIEPGKERD